MLKIVITLVYYKENIYDYNFVHIIKLIVL